jgi:flavin-dependent dehydrogenase
MISPGGWDAVVIGGGLAGLAAAIHLRRGGLRVICIEPDPFPHERVGESLDWSAPAHLARLGVPVESLIGDRVATPKHNIKVVSTDRPPFLGEPPDWWGHPWIGFEVATLHVDRVEMDSRLFALAQGLGVEFHWQRVVAATVEGDRVVAVETAAGERIEASWFLDASGRGPRLLARKFAIPRVDYGREKVCLWTYLEVPCDNPGTTFYVDRGEPYLSWIWEIPITPEVASIGLVMTAESAKEQRRQGKSVRDILRGQLALFPRFAPLLAGEPDLAVRVTAYRCYVHAKGCGPNWLLLGEAAALHDALTGNGVTAAFRHAYEGASLVLESRSRGSLTPRQRRAYNRNLRWMGRMFNHSIERAVYDRSIRWGLGLVPAQLIYVGCAFTLNALYTRFEPRRWRSALAFASLMQMAWLWIEGWALLGRIVCGVRAPRAGRSLRSAAAPG